MWNAIKVTIAATVLSLLAVGLAISDPQVNRIQTFSTGTAYRVATTHTQINSLFVQSLPGNTGLIYILFADPSLTCVASTTSQIVAELGPGSATQPGQSFTFPSNDAAQSQAGGTDASFWCAAGSTGDSAIISYNIRN